MTILLTGAAGQLGHALRQQVPSGVELIATSRSGDPATDLFAPRSGRCRRLPGRGA